MNAPFVGPLLPVRDEWIDYNGHLTDWAYAAICSDANEVFLDSLGLSSAYQARTGSSTYTVEAHLRYLAEVQRGSLIRPESYIVDADTKRIRVHISLYVHDQLVLTGEHLYLHVDQSTGRVVQFPLDRQAAVDAVRAAHVGIERESHIGRGVGQRG